MRYRLDKDNHIIWIGPGWIPFAHRNAGRDLRPKEILGRPLWAFIAGAETRHIYEALIQRVRSHQRAITVDFRCDSPVLRRYMKLTISPHPDSQLEFESRIIRKEKRAPIKLLEQTDPHASQFLTMCSWCKRIKLNSSAWVEVEAALEKMELFYSDDLPKLTHGICKECKEQVLNQLKKESFYE